MASSASSSSSDASAFSLPPRPHALITSRFTSSLMCALMTQNGDKPVVPGSFDIWRVSNEYNDKKIDEERAAARQDSPVFLPYADAIQWPLRMPTYGAINDALMDTVGRELAPAQDPTHFVWRRDIDTFPSTKVDKLMLLEKLLLRLASEHPHLDMAAKRVWERCVQVFSKYMELVTRHERAEHIKTRDDWDRWVVEEAHVPAGFRNKGHYDQFIEAVGGTDADVLELAALIKQEMYSREGDARQVPFGHAVLRIWVSLLHCFKVVCYPAGALADVAGFYCGFCLGIPPPDKSAPERELADAIRQTVPAWDKDARQIEVVAMDAEPDDVNALYLAREFGHFNPQTGRIFVVLPVEASEWMRRDITAHLKAALGGQLGHEPLFISDPDAQNMSQLRKIYYQDGERPVDRQLFSGAQ